MASSNLESKKKKNSYEVRRNGEIILYFRKDAFPNWFARLIWLIVGTIGAAIISYLRLWVLLQKPVLEGF
jgi:hypothetical protein